MKSLLLVAAVALSLTAIYLYRQQEVPMQSQNLLGVTLTTPNSPQTAKLRIVNGCQKGAMYIDYQAPSQMWAQNLRLDSNQAADYDIPKSGVPATRFWPKYNCDGAGQNCEIGESGGPFLPCPSKGCSPPVDSKFEATFQGVGQDDWFDTSHVDGWSLPYTFHFRCTQDQEIFIDCSSLTSDKCPQQFVQGAGDVKLSAINPNTGGYAGCYSPCGLLTFRNWFNPFAKYFPSDPPADEYCCAGQYSTSETCHKGRAKDMEFTKVVHQHCPGVYAWAYDDGTGLYHCPSEQTQFTVTFLCPS